VIGDRTADVRGGWVIQELLFDGIAAGPVTLCH